MAVLSSEQTEPDVMILARFVAGTINLPQEMLSTQHLRCYHIPTVKCRLKKCPSAFIFSHLSTEHLQHSSPGVLFPWPPSSDGVNWMALCPSPKTFQGRQFYGAAILGCASLCTFGAVLCV